MYRKVGFLFGALLAAYLTTASADPLTFAFTGQVEFVDPGLSSAAAVGDTVSGSFTFDTSVPDALPADPTLGFYLSPGGYSVAVGSFSSAGSGPFIVTFNDFPTGPLLRDQYSVTLGSQGQIVNGNAYERFVFDLMDVELAPAVPMTLTTDALPTAPLLFDALDLKSFFFAFLSPTRGEVHIQGSLTSLTQLSTVPEPATMALFGIALAGLRFSRRKRSAN